MSLVVIEGLIVLVSLPKRWCVPGECMGKVVIVEVQNAMWSELQSAPRPSLGKSSSEGSNWASDMMKDVRQSPVQSRGEWNF